MARKTIDVRTLIEWVNTRCATPDSTLHLGSITPEQAFRLGAASLLEQVLHATDTYAGFGYNDTEWDAEKNRLRDHYDETRRHYMISRKIREA